MSSTTLRIYFRIVHHPSNRQVRSEKSLSYQKKKKKTQCRNVCLISPWQKIQTINGKLREPKKKKKNGCHNFEIEGFGLTDKPGDRRWNAK